MKQICFFYVSTLILTVVVGAILFGIFNNIEGNAILFSLLITMGGQFSPTIAYLLTKRKYREKMELNLGWKLDKWFWLSMIFPTVAIILATSALSVMGIRYSPFDFQGQILFVSILTIFVGSIGEEIGWRGYLLTKMNDYYSLFVSSLIVGLLWGLWHFFKIAGNGFTIYLLFVFAMTLLGVIMGYIYNKSNSSVINMVILHAFLNFSTLVMLWKREGIAFYIVLITVFLIVIGFLWLGDKEYFKIKK